MSENGRGLVFAGLLVAAALGVGVFGRDPKAVEPGLSYEEWAARRVAEAEAAAAADRARMGGLRDADPLTVRDEPSPSGSLAGAMERARETGAPVAVRLLMGEGRSQEWREVTVHPDGRTVGADGREVLSAADAARMVAAEAMTEGEPAGGAVSESWGARS